MAAIWKHPIGIQGLMRIRAVYAADEALRALPPSKRKVMRAQHVRPPLESFFEWVQQARTVAEGHSLATSALGYASNQEKELLRVLDDGRLKLSSGERTGATNPPHCPQPHPVASTSWTAYAFRARD